MIGEGFFFFAGEKKEYSVSFDNQRVSSKEMAVGGYSVLPSFGRLAIPGLPSFYLVLNTKRNVSFREGPSVWTFSRNLFLWRLEQCNVIGRGLPSFT